ncbi:MAG: SDR family NAD(P)-dependent oxidoreductase [Kiritimatiellae bacterium]|nr:SDR family NAD(P)-dependent oxidoreductase [Kiritimatiellia bacterium]
MAIKFNSGAKSVLITGASSGIGEALAVECARRGARHLFLCARNAERLNAVAEACRALGADVHVKVLDVTDDEGVRRWVEECEAAAPFEVVFANAGVATGAEKEANVRRTFSTNVRGCMNVALAALACYRSRKLGNPAGTRRQIVLTASIAGYAPLASCPSYSASKAAVKTWGLANRRPLSREGICMNVVCPGFVRSRITDMNTCPMPFFMEADRAARIILDRVDRNVGLIAFPWPMRLASWLLSICPWPLAECISSMLPEKSKA